MAIFKTKNGTDEVTVTLTDEGDGCVVVSVSKVDFLRFLPANRGIALIWNNEEGRRKCLTACRKGCK